MFRCVPNVNTNIPISHFELMNKICKQNRIKLFTGCNVEMNNFISAERREKSLLLFTKRKQLRI